MSSVELKLNTSCRVAHFYAKITNISPFFFSRFEYKNADVFDVWRRKTRFVCTKGIIPEVVKMTVLQGLPALYLFWELPSRSEKIHHPTSRSMMESLRRNSLVRTSRSYSTVGFDPS